MSRLQLVKKRIFKYKTFFKVFLVLVILVYLLVLFVSLEEYITVKYTALGDQYPWGCKCFLGMEDYATKETYLIAQVKSFFASLLIISGSVFLWKYFLTRKVVSEN